MSFMISAGMLGNLAMPDFCPRCFWIKLKCEKLPFQIPMPSIFSSIDPYALKISTAIPDYVLSLRSLRPITGVIEFMQKLGTKW